MWESTYRESTYRESTPYSEAENPHIVCVYSHTLHIWGAEGNTQQLSEESDASRMYILTPYNVCIFPHPTVYAYSHTLSHVYIPKPYTPEVQATATQNAPNTTLCKSWVYTHTLQPMHILCIYSHTLHIWVIGKRTPSSSRRDAMRLGTAPLEYIYLYTLTPYRVFIRVYLYMLTHYTPAVQVRAHPAASDATYGVATVSRIDKITGLCCRI